MDIQLNDKVAIVTGGTRGIGLATVKTFLDAGAIVIFLGSRQATVDKASELINNKNAYGYVVDSKDAKTINAFAEEIEKKFGHIDILVNNAGVSDAVPFERYEEGRFENVMDINVNFLMKMTNAVTKVMIKQHHGVILNTSSMVSFNGQPSGVAYPASKFAVNGITISLARELGKYNIRVNAVAPGVTETDMVKALKPELVQRITAAIPLGRVGQPEDIANAFLFLASDYASYISGTVLKVDGATIS